MDVRRRRIVRLAGLPSRPRLRHVLVPMLLAGGIAGCTLPPPAGTAPLRYRDVIFPNLTTASGLTYGSAPDLSGNQVTLTLDMYQPTGDTQRSRPAIVLVHGGSFVGGSSTDSGVVKLAKAFAQRGYVAVSINYRLLGDKEKCGQEDPPSQACVTAVLAAQHDAQAAVRWLRANAGTYGIDASRVAIEGTSAGAGTALAVAVNSGDPGDSGNPGYSSKVGAAAAISADFPHSLASTYFDPGDSPILMFNGTADQVVPFADAAQTAADLYNAKVPVIFEQLDGAGHVPFKTYGDLMITQSVYFCYYMLDLAHAAGQPPSAAAAFARQLDRMVKRNPRLRSWSRSRALPRDRVLNVVRR
jgi:para-nitrobenzyl esterase